MTMMQTLSCDHTLTLNPTYMSDVADKDTLPLYYYSSRHSSRRSRRSSRSTLDLRLCVFACCMLITARWSPHDAVEPGGRRQLQTSTHITHYSSLLIITHLASSSLHTAVFVWKTAATDACYTESGRQHFCGSCDKSYMHKYSQQTIWYLNFPPIYYKVNTENYRRMDTHSSEVSTL